MTERNENNYYLVILNKKANEVLFGDVPFSTAMKRAMEPLLLAQSREKEGLFIRFLPGFVYRAYRHKEPLETKDKQIISEQVCPLPEGFKF